MIALEPFLTDVQELRRRALEQIECGPPARSHKGDLKQICDILNQLLAMELLCVLRYRGHYFSATAMNEGPVAQEFFQHAGEEQQHADRIAECITQLGGSPNFSPEGMQSRSHSEYVEGENLLDMIKEDLVAERIAIDSYTEMIRYIGENDITTRRILESILAVEEEHADDLASFLADMDKDWKTRNRKSG